MSATFTMPGLQCPKMSIYVSLDQSEAQCREKHDCGKDGKCPLEGELGRHPLERALRSFPAFRDAD